MKPVEVLRTAFFDTLHDSLNGDARGAISFAENLQSSAALIEPPTSNLPSEHMAYMLLTHGRPDVPVSVRKEHAKIALHQTRDTILTGLADRELIDLDKVKSQAGLLSNTFIRDTLALATSYPSKADSTESQRVMIDLLNPNKDSFEDTIVSVSVLYDVFEPYLLDRLVDLNVYDRDILGNQLGTIKEDFGLLLDFSKSIEPVIELLANGRSGQSTRELADRLYGIGPIFAKMVQSFADSIPISSPSAKQLAKDLQAAFQDGVAPPNESELQSLQADFPNGLKANGVISSASIAYILSSSDSLGQEFATKLPRPGIEDAVTRNIRLYELLYGVLFSYVREHAGGDSAYTSELATVEKVLPFFMKISEASIRRELDFLQEASAQKKAGIIYKRLKGVIIPEVVDQYSDETHITMSRVDAERFEALPANMAYLRNIFIFSLELWRNRFWHSNPHGGNVKGRENGSIVVYDWGQNIDIPREFLPRLRSYVFALARRDPKAIARAYCKIQSSDHNQATETEVRNLAKEVFDARKIVTSDITTDGRSGRIGRVIGELKDTQKTMALSLALRHQSIMDRRYLYFLSSVVEISAVLETELAKPEYNNNWKKYRAIAQAIVGAVNEVYIKGGKRGEN